jgi:signal transduction histidine kinase
MLRIPTIAKKRIRRLYYVGTVILLVLTATSFALPTYLGIRNELERKIDQLYEGIVNQKKLFLESVVVEKISDIERVRAQFANQTFSPDPEEMDRRFRIAVKEIIHSTELPDDGYIWINEIVNYDGGDDYAIRFAHPNLTDTEGDYLSTNTEDIVGNRPYFEELEGVKANGEVFFDYYFPKMNSQLISHKLTFAKLYEPYNWVVATGVYLDDVDMLVETESEKMRLSTNRTLRGIGIVILVAGIVLTTMSVLFETRIQQLISSYIEALQNSNDELSQEKSKLQSINRQKDRIFSIISHDLSGPIGNLRVLNDHLTTMVEQPDIERSVLIELSELIGASVESTAALLENLLLWSRSQRNVIEFKPVKVPAIDLVVGAVNVCNPAAREKGVAITHHGDSSIIVDADPDMIRTVLRNLIGNAVKFTPSGSSVSIEVSSDSSSVIYRIRDTGVGMSEQQVNSLFKLETVQSTRGTNSEKGSGLGLLLCKEFVDQHDGTMDISSQPGNGTEIVVRLPVDQSIRTSAT